MLKNKKGAGFTLVELLVVIAVLGVLVTIGLTSFTSAQMRGRDTQRKSDLKEVSSSLEIYYNDYGRYPSASGGQILGCPIPVACTWGTGQFTDGKTIYFKVLPKDPSKSYNYYYRTVTVNSVANQGFQLYAKLENSQDPVLISTDYSCGTSTCNFALTSPNVTATE